jgi:hypothetical protein
LAHILASWPDPHAGLGGDYSGRDTRTRLAASESVGPFESTDRSVDYVAPHSRREYSQVPRLPTDCTVKAWSDDGTGSRRNGHDRQAPSGNVSGHQCGQKYRYLQKWLATNGEFLQWRQRFKAALSEWERVGRNQGALLGGTPLAEAERWMASELAEPTPMELEFLHASREEEQRVELLSNEALRRKEQEALRLVAEAYRLLYSAPEKALLLSTQSLEIDPTAQAEEAKAAAFDVLLKRREVQQQDARQWGSGLAWIAPTFFEGKISAQLSRDGRYAVLATDRASSDAYLGGTDMRLSSLRMRPMRCAAIESPRCSARRPKSRSRESERLYRKSLPCSRSSVLNTTRHARSAPLQHDCL